MKADLIKRLRAHASGALPLGWTDERMLLEEAATALEAEASEGERLREALITLRGFMPPAGDDRVDEALRSADAALIPAPAREGE